MRRLRFLPDALTLLFVLLLQLAYGRHGTGVTTNLLCRVTIDIEEGDYYSP